MRRLKLALPIAALAIGSCAARVDPAANVPSGPPPLAPASRPAPAVPATSRTATTAAGQPIILPAGPAELVVAVTALPPGAVVPMHRHLHPRYVTVEEGSLRMTFADGRPGRDFGPGDVIVEPIDVWHEGRVTSAGPARLRGFDLVPPGQTNMIRRDAA